jgi:hypothetical protein
MIRGGACKGAACEFAQLRQTTEALKFMKFCTKGCPRF